MSNQFTDPLASDPSAPIVIGAVSTGRVSKEQLAAAERARLYHINKLAAYRAPTLPEVDALAHPQPAEAAGDASGAH